MKTMQTFNLNYKKSLCCPARRPRQVEVSVLEKSGEKCCANVPSLSRIPSEIRHTRVSTPGSLVHLRLSSYSARMASIKKPTSSCWPILCIKVTSLCISVLSVYTQ